MKASLAHRAFPAPLVVNMGTARAFGLAIPQGLQARARLI
jgi:hypothetical protein